MLSLVHRDRVCAGVVVNPFTGAAAASGTSGDWLEEIPTAWRGVRPDCSVSRTEAEDGSVARIAHALGPITRVGSAAYKLLRVAVGRDSVTVSVQPKSEWDVCGGVALLQARNCQFARLDGAALRFNQPSTRIPSGYAAGPADAVARVIDAIRRIDAAAS